MIDSLNFVHVCNGKGLYERKLKMFGKYIFLVQLKILEQSPVLHLYF